MCRDLSESPPLAHHVAIDDTIRTPRRDARAGLPCEPSMIIPPVRLTFASPSRRSAHARKAGTLHAPATVGNRGDQPAEGPAPSHRCAPCTGHCVNCRGAIGHRAEIEWSQTSPKPPTPLVPSPLPAAHDEKTRGNLLPKHHVEKTVTSIQNPLTRATVPSAPVAHRCCCRRRRRRRRRRRPAPDRAPPTMMNIEAFV